MDKDKAWREFDEGFLKPDIESYGESAISYHPHTRVFSAMQVRMFALKAFEAGYVAALEATAAPQPAGASEAEERQA